MSLRTALFLSSAALAASASFADPAVPSNNAANSPAAASKALDPNEVICERLEETGSRLASKRVCMTRSQWADQKTQDRQELEKVQVERGTMSPH